MSTNAGIQVIDGVTLFPDLQTILMTDSASAPEFREDYELEPISLGKYKIMPWGPDNLLPYHLLSRVAANDIVGANLKFNISTCFGLGPKLIRVLARKNGKVTDYEEVTEGKEHDWFERNDIAMFMQQQLTDMNYFYNSFSEMHMANGVIDTIRHREAVYSRWSEMDTKGSINKHYYADWNDSPTSKDIIARDVVDEFDPINYMTMYKGKKDARLIFPSYMPSPGRPYYSRPEWYSIFNSGWYDHSCMVPKLKKSILQNQLGVKYIIYVAQEYFDDICRKEGIDKNDLKAYRDRIEKEKQAFADFLSGEKNASKTIMTIKQMIPTANGSTEQKWIEIVPVKNDLTGNEYIDDTESTANIICYAMGVHSALIGATPGKNASTISGSNARELFLMKQALMKPIVDRCLRPLKVVKEFNGWDKDVMITIPEYIFTTLDQNKSGKQESTNTNV
jgi:hypothetical protein